jgi:hypothetical protein
MIIDTSVVAVHVTDGIAANHASEVEFANEAILATRNWLQRAVIGLELCPFAPAPFRAERIRYSVSDQRSAHGLRQDLLTELAWLHAASADLWETTLLIHPRALRGFLDYNEFLDEADAAIVELDLDGELQVASFHPDYQFDGTSIDDVENCSNRSPYPTLHLLRESSVERAIASHPDIDAIPVRNGETLRRLGRDGWRKLWE